MKQFLSVMLGMALVLGTTTMVATANEPEKHDKKEEHKAPAPDHKPDHKPDHQPEHK